MKSKQIALCGLLCALAVTFLLLGGILGIGTFAGSILAMAVLLPILEEYGAKTAAAAYGAAAILALLLVPDRETALVFVAFGWYPLLRPRLDRVPSKPVRLLIKLAVCTGIIAVLYGLVLRLMGLTADLLDASRWMNILLLVLANVTFQVMDRALERLTVLWRCKLRKQFFR